MLKFGSYVFCIDHLPGQSAKLLGVIINAKTLQVTDLVVGRSTFHPQDRIIPLSALKQVSGNQIYLSISAANLSDYPEYRLTPVHPKAQRAIFPAVPPNSIVIGSKTRLFQGQESLGYVEQVCLDETTAVLTHLKTKRSLSRQGLLIPASAIEQLNHSRIYISRAWQAQNEVRPTKLSARRWPALLNLPQRLAQLSQKRPAL